jgi:hypothetical protein
MTLLLMKQDGSMTLLGKIVRLHILEATPLVYARPPRWGLILIFAVITFVLLKYLE